MGVLGPVRSPYSILGKITLDFQSSVGIYGRQHKTPLLTRLIALQIVLNMSLMVLDSANTLNPVPGLLTSDPALFCTALYF